MAKYECINCDFKTNSEKKKSEHEEAHKRVFASQGKDIPTGFWQKVDMH